MKFLLDQDVYSSTARFLRNLGHDVVRVSEIGLSQAADEDLLSIARQKKRIFVTRDRDYGGLVFLKGLGPGVIYLRMLPATQDMVHSELERAIARYTEEEIKKAFIVVEADGHRIRWLSEK